MPFLENISFPVVNCNIDISKETRLTGLFNRSVVLPVDDHMVGIIGVITQNTGSLVNPGRTDDNVASNSSFAG